MEPDADRVAIPVRLLGFEGQTVMNTVSDHPPLEIRRPAMTRLSASVDPDATPVLADVRIEKYRAAYFLGPDDGGPLVIYHRVE